LYGTKDERINKMGKIINGDSIECIKNIDTESVHLILSDIPYGISFDDWDVLHSNTNSALLKENPLEKQAGGVFKKRGKPLNGWSKADKNIPYEYYEWCMSWAGEWYRVMKAGASCFIFDGRRMAHRCICAMEDSGFIFKDMIAWEKNSAMYRAQRISCVYERRNDHESAEEWDGWKVGNLRPIFEPVLWFMKPYPIGSTLADNILTNGVGAFNENALKENIIKVSRDSNDSGLHPTQKSVKLMESFINLTTRKGQCVLDPFCGSGSTLVAAENLDRDYIGIELNEGYYNTAKQRLHNLTA
jgi:site-specific DNA-methyltransferase (adenine-specific)